MFCMIEYFLSVIIVNPNLYTCLLILALVKGEIKAFEIIDGVNHASCKFFNDSLSKFQKKSIRIQDLTLENANLKGLIILIFNE